mmetsp:Transcript_116169/g.213433  ORF Transcript_116169/g.213433 Transcript_116169/m.213433 type:complete len:296 (-) Transcript_116169:944-1831(-)
MAHLWQRDWRHGSRRRLLLLGDQRHLFVQFGHLHFDFLLALPPFINSFLQLFQLSQVLILTTLHFIHCLFQFLLFAASLLETLLLLCQTSLLLLLFSTLSFCFFLLQAAALLLLPPVFLLLLALALLLLLAQTLPLFRFFFFGIAPALRLFLLRIFVILVRRLLLLILLLALGIHILDLSLWSFDFLSLLNDWSVLLWFVLLPTSALFLLSALALFLFPPLFVCRCKRFIFPDVVLLAGAGSLVSRAVITLAGLRTLAGCSCGRSFPRLRLLWGSLGCPLQGRLLGDAAAGPRAC